MLLVIVTASLLAVQIQAQNSGDIRLVNYQNRDGVFDTLGGQLEIFINGKWGTICGNSGTDLQAVADTACRQLGLSRATFAFGFGTVTQLGYPVAPKSTPIHFGSIDCGSSINWNDPVCSTDYCQHVLHCSVDTRVDTTACTHDEDIAI